MKPKRACAFLFASDIRFHSQLHTPFGLFACPPFQRVERAAGAAAIAQAIRVALDHSGEAPDIAGTAKEFAKVFLAGMGVKSNAQLQRQAKYVAIEQAGGELVFHPSHNGGTAGDTKGFQPITGQAPVRVATNAAAADLAAALLRAFELCTSAAANG